MTMKNLAGDVDCDAHIRRELRRAIVPAISCDRDPNSEVPYRVRGQIGPFALRRAWTYWVATGPVPIEVARALHADPIGREDVRVAGSCACPPPEHPWLDELDGRRAVSLYHIDSEAGLRLYADAVRSIGVAGMTERRGSVGDSRFCVKCGVRVVSEGGCPLCEFDTVVDLPTEAAFGRAQISLPARKEWDAERHDCGDVSEEDGCESSDYVDGWNDALDATEREIDREIESAMGRGPEKKE
jgi:hypothetical protein